MRSKPGWRKNTTWPSKQAAYTAPHVFLRTGGAVILADPEKADGVGLLTLRET